MSLDLHLESGQPDNYWTNITHNLTDMAEEVGLYKPLWRPEDNGYKTGKDLIGPLEEGIKLLKTDPEKYKQYNTKNGWGTYSQFLSWLMDLLEACKARPNFKIRVHI